MSKQGYKRFPPPSMPSKFEVMNNVGDERSWSEAQGIIIRAISLIIMVIEIIIGDQLHYVIQPYLMLKQ
jgi:hypothetical protein